MLPTTDFWCSRLVFRATNLAGSMYFQPPRSQHHEHHGACAGPPFSFLIPHMCGSNTPSKPKYVEALRKEERSPIVLMMLVGQVKTRHNIVSIVESGTGATPYKHSEARLGAHPQWTTARRDFKSLRLKPPTPQGHRAKQQLYYYVLC